jgi:S1-C subfamily serine protease
MSVKNNFLPALQRRRCEPCFPAGEGSGAVSSCLSRPFALLAVLILSVLSASSTAQQTSEHPVNDFQSPGELFKSLSPSVFVVETLDAKGTAIALGSGVSVAKDEVVTNRHVVEDGKAWRIRQGDNTWAARIAFLDAEHDLCGLQVRGLSATPVTVRVSSTLSVGERVYALGAPEGLELSLSEGLVSGLRKFEGVSLIQTTAPISHGSSGGGLFDAQGRLIGITGLGSEHDHACLRS